MQGHWVVRVALAVWLGLIVPLLCIPGISSNHTHGLHWVWEIGGSEPASTPAPSANAAASSHSHSHGGDGHSHSHSHDDAPPPPAPPDAIPAPRVIRATVPTLSTTLNTTTEQLMNVFGMMQIPPLPLTLLVNAGWVFGLLGLWLFRAMPPRLRPWQPPKALA